MNTLEAQVEKMKVECDHQDLTLRKHGIPDRSSNKSLKSLAPRMPAGKAPEESTSSAPSTRHWGYLPWVKQN